jgi:hypothetical protein
MCSTALFLNHFHVPAHRNIIQPFTARLKELLYSDLRARMYVFMYRDMHMYVLFSILCYDFQFETFRAPQNHSLKFSCGGTRTQFSGSKVFIRRDWHGMRQR